MRTFISKIRRQEPGIYHRLYRMAVRTRQARLPQIRWLGATLFHGRDLWIVAWSLVKSRLIYEPMLRYRCTVGKNVTLDGDMPYVYGDGVISLGDDVRIGNRSTFIVGLKVFPHPVLEIGSRSVLGYMTLISVAQSVRIGRDCLFAGEVKIIDNNSHSLDYEARRRNAPLEPHEVAPIVIEDDVWIGTNCIVLKGVTIGRGSVVAAGSVVTRTVPPFTVVAGSPARIVKQIEPHHSRGLAGLDELLKPAHVYADSRHGS